MARAKRQKIATLAGLQSVDLLELSDPIRLVRIGERDGELVIRDLFVRPHPACLDW